MLAKHYDKHMERYAGRDTEKSDDMQEQLE